MRFVGSNLPGFWTLPIPSDLVPILDDVGTGNVWLAVDWLKNQNSTFPYYNGLDQVILTTDNLDAGHNCYCTAKQLPRVEYTFCNGPWENTLECAEEKTSAGWYPLGGISAEEILGHVGQAFWRWAE